jgi:CHAT domain-containing protein/tetratricopeptide (TPR) repeat protein
MFAKFFSIVLLLSMYAVFPVYAQDRKAEAEKLFAEGETLRASDKAESRREAVKKYKNAVQIFSELNLREREAAGLNNIGYVYMRLGEFEKSLTFLEKSLQTSREINEQRLQAIALINMGRISRILGKPKEALVQVSEALSISRATGDREREAAALNELGVTYFNDGETHKSLLQFELAAAIFKDLGQLVPQASLLNNMARINRILGNQDEAIAQYGSALEIFRSAKHRMGEADVTLNLASTYMDLFRTAEALEHANRALSFFRETGDRQREAVILGNLGSFYNNLGDFPKSLDYHNQAAEIAEKVGDRGEFSNALQNIGIIHLNFNENDKALDFFNRALEIKRVIKDRRGEAYILNNLGLIYDKKADYAKALDFFRQSLEIHRAVGNREGEARTLLNLGLTAYHTKENEKALEYYAEALRLRRELQTPAEESKVLLYMARLEREMGNSAKARKTIEEAINIIESLRTNVPGQELRTSFFSLGKDAYDFYIDLLMRTDGGKPSAENLARALETSERARARSLLETLIESRADVRRGIDARLLERERALQNRLNAKESYRMRLLGGKPKPEQIEAVEKEIRALLGEYQQIRAQIRTDNPNYAALTQPQPITLAEIQKDILDRDTLLLEYALGEEQSYVWAVTSDSITGYALPKRAEIEAAARRFYKLLAPRKSQPENETPLQRRARLDAADRELSEASRHLSEMLLRPAAAQFGNKRLLIIAEGILQYIPFAAFSVSDAGTRNRGGAEKISVLSSQRTTDNEQRTTGSERFLIETNEIVYLPSASTLSVLRKAKENKKTEPKILVAILADPVFTNDDARVRAFAGKKAAENDVLKNSNVQAGLLPPQLRSDFARLRFSRAEAEAISDFASDNRKFLAMDFAANIQAATGEIFGNARIVHFATHGVINSDFPELSGIVLSLIDENGSAQEGFLRLHDIYNLNLNADLVVLSACDTALGKEVKGEGVVGLTRGFMYAGATGVVASLWKINDRATAELMRRFYQKMLKENLRPAAALRAAQISMAREKATRNPFYWAAFTLQGDWR